MEKIGKIFFGLADRKLAGLFNQREKKITRALKLMQASPQVRVIKPRGTLPLASSFDRGEKRINRTFDRGVGDAEEFVRGA